MQVYTDEHLYHFGIKGMRWGHHKRQIESLASRVGTKIERTAYSIEHKLIQENLVINSGKLQIMLHLMLNC